MDKTDIQAYLEAGKLLYAMVNQNLLVSTNKGRLFYQQRFCTFEGRKLKE